MGLQDAYVRDNDGFDVGVLEQVVVASALVLGLVAVPLDLLVEVITKQGGRLETAGVDGFEGELACG